MVSRLLQDWYTEYPGGVLRDVDRKALNACSTEEAALALLSTMPDDMQQVITWLIDLAVEVARYVHSLRHTFRFKAHPHDVFVIRGTKLHSHSLGAFGLGTKKRMQRALSRWLALLPPCSSRARMRKRSRLSHSTGWSFGKPTANVCTRISFQYSPPMLQHRGFVFGALKRER